MRREKKRNLLFLATFLYISLSAQLDEEWFAKHNPPSLKGRGKKVYKDYYAEYPQEYGLSKLDPEARTILHLCFSISYIWRHGRKQLHKYYDLRLKYFNHLPFEIGYITQTIMAKYQNVLELYEFTTRKEPGHYIGRPHLLFFYKNILEDCRSIIHLCNMLHEVTRKYKIQQYNGEGWGPERVIYEPSAKFQDPVAFPEYKDSNGEVWKEIGVEGFDHDKPTHEDPAMFERIKEAGTVLQKERQKELNIVKPQKNYYLDHGMFSPTIPTTRRTKRWRSNDPMLYGWEPEDNPLQ